MSVSNKDRKQGNTKIIGDSGKITREGLNVLTTCITRKDVNLGCDKCIFFKTDSCKECSKVIRVYGIKDYYDVIYNFYKEMDR